MRVFIVNPSDLAFGIAVITPRWLFVLAGATPRQYGDPIICDETLEPFDASRIAPGDVVGVGVHTSNALRGYSIGRAARAAGATVVFGGIHSTLYPDEVREQGHAHAVVRGDGDIAWGRAPGDIVAGNLQPVYEGGKLPGDQFVPARWDLLPTGRYMPAPGHTVRGG